MGLFVVLTLLVVVAATTARADFPPPHAAITVTRDADFVTCECVTSGSGTAADPFVIGPWKVTAPDPGGWALKVDNSKGKVTKFFNVAGIEVQYNDTNPSNPVVWLVKVTNPTDVANVVANAAGTGVRLTLFRPHRPRRDQREQDERRRCTGGVLVPHHDHRQQAEGHAERLRGRELLEHRDRAGVHGPLQRLHVRRPPRALAAQHPRRGGPLPDHSR